MVKEAREHHRQAFDTLMNLRDKISDDHNKQETTEYNRKIDAAKSKLAAKKDIEEKRIALTNAGDSKEAQIYQRQADSVNRIRDQFEKRHQTELENLRQVANLPETSNGDYQKKAVERLKEIDKERDKLNERLAKEFPLIPNLEKPAAPSAGGGNSVTTADGKTYTFPNAEAAQKFKTAAGIK
jgi:iron-sulfur cluster repair protein YtfE (RIC family)